MSENTAAAACTQEEWEAAREAGLPFFTTADERAIAAFAKAIRDAHVSCEQLHHGPKDRHTIGEPCPVEARNQAQGSVAMRRIVRVNRLVAECGHTDVIEALMELKRRQQDAQPDEEPPTCGPHGDF